MLTKPKSAVHFGAGNIGRGFIGQLLTSSGYHVTFIDVQDSVINALNGEDEYDVHILDEHESKVTVSNFSGLKTTDPATIEAIVNADIITTSVGPEILTKIAPTIANGLTKRREKGRLDVTVIACENMVGATSQLEEHVREHLKEEDIAFVDEHVGFANCEVDRIVPAFKGDDPLEVGVEGFYEWVVEKSKVKGDLQVAGMQLKDDLSPFLERKLYTLNCGHALIGYLGYVKGIETVHDALADDTVRGITEKALNESGAALIRKHGFDEKEHAEYVRTTMVRYANPNIHDELVRISRKPLRKLSPKERLVGAIGMCKEHGLPRDHLLQGVAAAFYFDTPDDEEAVELMKLIKEKGLHAAVEETTEFTRDSEEHQAVLDHYHRLGEWKKKD